MTAVHQLAEYAADYAADGYEIFPVDPATKAPLGELVPHGHKDATTDIDTINWWWQTRPDALIGCRIPPGIVVLDIDPRHGGDDVWAALLDLHGPLESRSHFSGRGDGGFHIWLQHPGGDLTVKPLHAWAEQRGLGHAINERKWSSGIDLLHHGHRYSILPPSPHPETGDPYTWANETDPAPCPGWLTELITKPQVDPGAQLPTLHPSMQPARSETSIADWWSNTASWGDLLPRHGWTLVSGDGDSDGSTWRHPNATASSSATIRHRCLFVYSPNTPFEETADGDPHGYTLFRALAELEHAGDLSAAARTLSQLPGAPQAPRTDIAGFIAANTPQAPLDGTGAADGGNPLAGQLVNWHEFWGTDHKAEDFICAPILARGRGHALYAKAKTGKSLVVLEMAAALATGRPFLQHQDGDPVRVLYIDFEMTPADLHERLEAFGYGPDDNLDHLYYVQFPAIAPIDTADGGLAVLAAAAEWSPEVVIIDTTARAVSGDENAMETFRDAYRHTFGPLKGQGITTLRVDHAGKDLERGQRGSSAKNDDVDIVWELTRKATDGADEHLTLKATHRRMGWVPEQIDIVRSDDRPPMHRLPAGVTEWPAGTKALADELDAAGVPLSAGRRTLRSEYGIEAKDRLLGAAQKFRRERKTQTFATSHERSQAHNVVPAPPGEVVPGTTSGHHPPKTGTTPSDQPKQAGTTPGTTPAPPPQSHRAPGAPTSGGTGDRTPQEPPDHPDESSLI